MNRSVTRRAVLSGIGSGAATLLFRASLAPARTFSPPDALPGVALPELELVLRAVSDRILRITVTAAGEPFERIYSDGSLVMTSWPEAMLRSGVGNGNHSVPWGSTIIGVQTKPLRIGIHAADGRVLQSLSFDSAPARISFFCGDVPLYGLGAGVHPFDRRGTQDAMQSGQLGDDLATFGAHLPIPWLMSPQGWGLFFHEPWGRFDLRGEVGIFKPDEAARSLDVFLLLGDTPPQLLQQWAELTGYPHLPPIWALGYQQSHRTLASSEEVLLEAKTFREKKLPCDALIYLGTGFCPSGWNTGHGSFTFNEKVFPYPGEMIRALHRDDFKVVLHVVNPPLNLHGKVSDAAPADPEDAANYWALHAPLDRIGVDGWWPDEGDPLTKACRLTRNKMYWEGDQLTRLNVRPYALHRNGYAGMQRYGWLWSGDVLSTWKTLASQVMEGINTGLCGIPYWGTDTGGFIPTKEFTAELFLRWFQFSAFCPLFRGHGRTWKLRLPWGWDMGNYGPAELSPEVAAEVLPKADDLHNSSVERICRKYLNTRYQLLPYIYSAVEQTHSTGIPLMRALWLHYPQDAQVRSIADEYLFGPSLLVAPVLEPGAKVRAVYLPAGQWWDFWTSKQVAGNITINREVELESTPIFVKAGAILPTGPVKQFATEASAEPVTLTIYPGSDGNFVLYEDDGTTFDYQRGRFTRTELQWNDTKGQLHLKSLSGPAGHPRRFLINMPGEKSLDVLFDGSESTVNL